MMMAGSSALVSTGVKSSDALAQTSWKLNVPGPGPSIVKTCCRSGRSERIPSIFSAPRASVTTARAPLFRSRNASASGPNSEKRGTVTNPERKPVHSPQAATRS